MSNIIFGRENTMTLCNESVSLSVARHKTPWTVTWLLWHASQSFLTSMTVPLGFHQHGRWRIVLSRHVKRSHSVLFLYLAEKIRFCLRLELFLIFHSLTFILGSSGLSWRRLLSQYCSHQSRTFLQGLHLLYTADICEVSWQWAPS